MTVDREGKPLPLRINAFEIAALTVGVMEESAQAGDPPSTVELLELLELVQAGMALLTRGRRSYNWQVTVATATDGSGELANTRPGGITRDLPRLRNLLDEAATGVRVLVGIYPHRGEAENVHPADTIGLQRGDEEQEQHSRGQRQQPDAVHVSMAQKYLRRLLPFIAGGT